MSKKSFEKNPPDLERMIVDRGRAIKIKTREGLRVKKPCLGDLLNGQSACLIWCVKNIANEEEGTAGSSPGAPSSQSRDGCHPPSGGECRPPPVVDQRLLRGVFILCVGVLSVYEVVEKTDAPTQETMAERLLSSVSGAEGQPVFLSGKKESLPVGRRAAVTGGGR